MRLPNPERFQPNLSVRYIYGVQSGQFIKIGVALNIAVRLNTMRLSNPHKLTVVYRRKMRAAYYCEKKMHEILAPKGIGREWFDATIEEVRAAGVIGAALAREIYLRETMRSIAFDAPLTHVLVADAENPMKTGTI